MGVIQRDKDILGSEPTFDGTRVPIKTLFDYLGAGDSLEEFLDNFPSVGREQVAELIKIAGETLLSRLDKDSFPHFKNP